MFKLKTIAPQEATGTVAEAYSAFPPQIGVPASFRLLSASPQRMMKRLAEMQGWSEHPTFDPLMQTTIRYLFAAGAGLPQCRQDNGTLLRLRGLDDEQMASLEGDPAGWPLGERRNALVHFVYDTLHRRRPAQVDELDRLRGAGWSDAEIFEALEYGSMVQATITLVALLKE